ncbi:MAG: hypothetical protein FJ197_00790 [Gammaproteobacteria bacterium]|nr:hypothetical protein [Gammaproteobacteria bacterium]
MTDTAPAASPVTRHPRRATLALVAALVALAIAVANWLAGADREHDRPQAAEIAKLQQALQALDRRVEDGRSDDTVAEPLAARLDRIEDTIARMPGGGEARFLRAAEQAEEYLRAANARENLAGDTAGALVALSLADAHLQATGDPRFAAVRRLIAQEQAALRAVPTVDSEGLALRLDSLAQALPALPRKQSAPASFRAESGTVDESLAGLDRARAAVSRAFSSIVTIRRTPEPAATLLPDEAATVLVRSLELELQIARLSLLRGEAAGFRAALAATRRGIVQYLDTGNAGVISALDELDRIAATPLPEQLPDISGSLAAMVRLRESGDQR